MIFNILKKTANSFLLFAVALFLPACHLAVDKQTNIIHGTYVYGHEVNTFKKCGSNKVLWVIGDNFILHDLEEKYYKLTSHPYEEVYLELDATFLPRATDGFAMDYDGQINITKIFFMRKKLKVDCVN